MLFALYYAISVPNSDFVIGLLGTGHNQTKRCIRANSAGNAPTPVKMETQRLLFSFAPFGKQLRWAERGLTLGRWLSSLT